MAGQGYSPALGSAVSVLPSPTTYQQYSISAGQTVALSWPVDNFPANANVAAMLMNITPLGTGCALQMPAATNTSLGEKGLYFNAGSVPFTLKDSTGGTIVSIGPGLAIYVALVNNLTVAGTWLSFQFGAGTSAANSAALAGAGLGANGPFLQQIMPIFTISTNYTVGIADRDNFINWTGGAGTITLPLANSAGNNFYIQTRNSGSGTLAYACQGSDQINGAASLNFNVNDSAFIVTDGVNWFTIGLGSINTNLFNFQAVNLGGQTGTYVLPSNLQGKIAYRFTGALAGNVNIQVPATVQQYWVDNQTTGGFTLGIGTATQIAGATQFLITNAARFVLYSDGANVLNASTSGIGVPVSITQGGTGATSSSAALTNLGGTSVGVNVFTASTIAAAQGSLQVLSVSDAVAYSLIF